MGIKIITNCKRILPEAFQNLPYGVGRKKLISSVKNYMEEEVEKERKAAGLKNLISRLYTERENENDGVGLFLECRYKDPSSI